MEAIMAAKSKAKTKPSAGNAAKRAPSKGKAGGKKVAAKKVIAKKREEVIPAKGALVAVLPKVTHVQFTANSRALLLAQQSTKTLTLYDLESETETPPLKALPTFSTIA